MPPLNTLRAFEAAARLQSFARAADELFLTPAAISHRIKELEQRIGVRLFERRARGVALTRAGQRYYERVANVFVQIERATRELSDRQVDGQLTLSLPHSFAQFWLVPRLSGLHQSLPGLSLALRAESHALTFRENVAELGIRFGQGEYEGLHAESLMGDMVAVLAPATLVNSLSDTRPEALVTRYPLLEDSSIHASEPWSGWAPWLRDWQVPAELITTLRLSGNSLTLAACAEGAGLCISRWSVAAGLVRKGMVKPVTPWRRSEYSYYLVCHPAELSNPRVMAFRDWLVEAVEAFE